MIDIPKNNSELSAFTYFKDQQECIYYSRGDTSLDSDVVRGVLVYTPASENQATRLQLSSGTGYTKTLSHGYQSELPRLESILPPSMYSRVKAMSVKDSNTGDEFLAIPTTTIAEIYSPKKSLQDLLIGEASGYSEGSVARINTAVNLFVDQSISLGRLGVYGGLQCHLTHIDHKEINDIDILIDGLDAYKDVLSLAEGNKVRPETFPDFIAKDAVKRAVGVRRGQVSQFRLKNYPDTVVDVRLLRTPQDGASNLPPIYSEKSQGQVFFRGAVVIEASGSLSLPAHYEIEDEVGKSWSVITNQYHHLGAAKPEDQICVRGDIMDKGVIILTKPDQHYIYNPAAVAAGQTEDT